MKSKKIKFHLLTIFPEIFDSYLNESLLKRAQKSRIIDVKVWNLRDFSKERHAKVDDRPFGGGPGMVLMFEPIEQAIKEIKSKSKNKIKVVLFSTRGKKLDGSVAKKMSDYTEFILICGRYEGVDQRVADYLVDEEISIGNYVLSGGELPALVFLEAVSRFKKGFLGKYESLEELKGFYPVYTKPSAVKIKSKKIRVPEILLSGHHKKIKLWRYQEQLKNKKPL
jgi:tRNA (guanine37-N1)-methyltransferase